MHKAVAFGCLLVPTTTPAEFAVRTPGTVFGVSLTVGVPTGEYFPDKLVNIGANRWAFKPEAGLSWSAGRCSSMDPRESGCSRTTMSSTAACGANRIR